MNLRGSAANKRRTPEGGGRGSATLKSRLRVASIVNTRHPCSRGLSCPPRGSLLPANPLTGSAWGRLQACTDLTPSLSSRVIRSPPRTVRRQSSPQRRTRTCDLHRIRVASLGLGLLELSPGKAPANRGRGERGAIPGSSPEQGSHLRLRRSRRFNYLSYLDITGTPAPSTRRGARE